MEGKYDIVIIGTGHNGLVAACYLAQAGLSVLMLERNAEIGGATRSAEAFPGIDARLSVYAYLVSLFPQKIIEDLGLGLKLRTRRTASWTPSVANGTFRELLLRNDAPAENREAFFNLTGNRQLAEPLESCLAEDANGEPCIDAMSAVDLERKIHLPKGNIFHGNLTWPFAESEEEAGLWGVETDHPNVLLCGSSAKRGGAVSGIPGHNAAMKVLELIGHSGTPEGR